MFKKFLKYIPQIIASLFLVGFVAYAWTGPAGPPPTLNADAPINVGTATQTLKDNKTLMMNQNATGTLMIGGALGIGGVLRAFSDAIFDGQIKITGGSPGANKVLTSDADGLASWQYKNSIPNVQVFDFSGTWQVPIGVIRIMAQVWGGGGGGGGGIGCNNPPTNGGGGGGGGGGGVGQDFFNVTPGAVYTITVGAGGTGGAGNISNSASPGNSGGSSSFGALISANGGAGGAGAVNYSGYCFGGGESAGGESSALFNVNGINGKCGYNYSAGCRTDRYDGNISAGFGGAGGAFGAVPGGGAGGAGGIGLYSDRHGHPGQRPGGGADDSCESDPFPSRF